MTAAASTSHNGYRYNYTISHTAFMRATYKVDTYICGVWWLWMWLVPVKDVS